jgi:hypothetical protein
MQAGCLKATGMLSILLATLNIPSMDVQRSAMLTLRNLCFLSEWCHNFQST